MKQAVVIEINEIPMRLLRWYASTTANSTISELLSTATVAETTIDDRPEQGLYPSQTWATLSTGVPFDQHKIYWYGDPKPASYPLYWQAAAKHVSVGTFGALHSSPLPNFKEPGYRFFIPDAFADTYETLPNALTQLQRFNLRMTQENGLAAKSATPAFDYIEGIRSLHGTGIRPATLAQLTKLAAKVATGRAPKERLRTGQFILLADAFERQLKQTQPALAVFFTNHVAAAMHRYWPATFPRDWTEHPNSPEWIAKHAKEIPAALKALDRFLERILKWCVETDRALILISSMGQTGGADDVKTNCQELVIKDPHRFANNLDIPVTAELRTAMVPHLTFTFATEQQAHTEHQRLSGLSHGPSELIVDRSGNAVTITYHFNPNGQAIILANKELTIEQAGLEWVTVEAHRAGIHDPLGTLIAANASTTNIQAPVNVLEIAPAILELLGLQGLPHHTKPSFRL